MPSQSLFGTAANHLQRLRNLAPSATPESRGSGPFAFLVAFFLWKQLDHADAILRLGVHRDADLIARSMIEGLCQLKWAAQDPDERGDRWRRFTWVHDWRLLQKKVRAGVPVSARLRRRIEEGVAKHAADFLKKRKKTGSGRPPGPNASTTDPYVTHWSRTSVNALCSAVQARPLYEWAYAQFSDWHHWSPGGFVRATRRSGNRITFTEPNEEDALPTYVVAFQCLFETLDVANKTLDLGLDAELRRSHDAYLRDLDPARSPARNTREQSDA